MLVMIVRSVSSVSNVCIVCNRTKQDTRTIFRSALPPKIILFDKLKYRPRNLPSLPKTTLARCLVSQNTNSGRLVIDKTYSAKKYMYLGVCVRSTICQIKRPVFAGGHDTNL